MRESALHCGIALGEGGIWVAAGRTSLRFEEAGTTRPLKRNSGARHPLPSVRSWRTTARKPSLFCHGFAPDLHHFAPVSHRFA
jgi:hypothetical protein